MINVDSSKCTGCMKCADKCGFGAIDMVDGKIQINASCKSCKLCVKSCPEGAITFEAEKKISNINKNEWKGIMVYVEQVMGEIHPVSIELIGKAQELANKVKHPVYAVLVGGEGIHKAADELLYYGVDKTFVYSHKELEDFRVDSYSAAVENCINEVKPSVVLVGSTSIGRSIAPRLATRYRTGLTADCTVLDIKENSDLIQIRPAFGGNIMAQIVTPDTRPQFATVRYKIMSRAEKRQKPYGKIIIRQINDKMIKSGIDVISTIAIEKQSGLEEAEIIIAAGRGIKTKKDFQMLEMLADALGAQMAGTRPLVELGWIDYTRQIGLSGRTVKPKLIITCGISGAVQFAAGMKSSECIVAINTDKNAPIFNIANYCIVGDIYDVIPVLLEKLGKGDIEYGKAI